jgi:hypothetical protein
MTPEVDLCTRDLCTRGELISAQFHPIEPEAKKVGCALVDYTIRPCVMRIAPQPFAPLPLNRAERRKAAKKS